MKEVRIGFLSHLDLNLFLFRLPVMKRLVNEGIVVFAIIPRGEVFDKFKDYGIETIEYKIDRSSLNLFKEVSTIKNIKKIISEAQLDILHTFMHKPNIYGAFATDKKTITVNTVTGLGSFFIHNDFKSKFIRFIIENLYKITLKKSRAVIFQNSDDLNYFINKKLVKRDKAFLVKSSGIDTEYFKPVSKDEKLIKELGIGDKVIVLMIARVIEDKGVSEYINAAEKLKDKATFLYVGDIDKGNKNSFSPDFKNVQYLGFRNDIRELISVADIVVLPSYREGVPRTLLEAASMGKAIVTTDTVGCREVVQDGINGFLVPVKDSEMLSEKIEILADKKNLRERMGKKGREKAVNEFDVKIVVNEYLEIYKQLLKFRL